MKFDTTHLGTCACNQHHGRLKDRIKAHFEYTFLLMIEAIVDGHKPSANMYEEECRNLIKALEMTEVISRAEGDELFECVSCAPYWLH